VALDPATGKLDRTWRADVDASNLEGGGVTVLAANGTGILVGGVFNSIDGVRVPSLGEVDGETGRLVRRWKPPDNERACPWCSMFGVTVGEQRIYVSVNGPAKFGLVALARDTGAADPHWRARTSATAAILGGSAAFALAASGGRVYVAGDFDRLNGTQRNGFAALDPKTARVLPSWQPRAATVYGSLLARSGSRLLLGIELARSLRFDWAGLKTYRPVRRLRLTLALSGPGRVRIGLGRGCDRQRWLNSLRCSGQLSRWLDVVHFARAERKPYVRPLAVPAGRYFVRFVPESPKGVPQTPQDFPIEVPSRKARSSFPG
jgi:hypothetical protein